MHRFARLAVLVTAAVLCPVGAASAALTANLLVGTGSPGLPAVTISSSFALSDPPVGKIQYYVPAGYTLNPAAAPGAHVGTASAGVYVTDVVGQITQTGAIAVATAPVAEGQKTPSCDPGTHTASWVINLVGPNTSWSIPLYVDRTTGSETAFGATKLVVCLPPPDVATSNQNRALNGQRLLSLSLRLTAFANPQATGDVRWRALQTPYTAASGNLDQAGSVETQSIVSLPQRLTLAVKRQGRKATLSGAFTAAGKGVGATLVQLEVGKTKKRLSPFGRVTTNGAGTFSKSFALPGVRYFRANVTTGARSLGASACTASFGAAVPCIGAWTGGSHLLTALLRVAP
jgi:hypothetical protein